MLKRTVLPSSGTTKELYSSYFAWYCVQQRYLRDVPCKFKGFLELVKRVYPLHPALETPGKKRVAEDDRNNQPSTSKHRPISPEIVTISDDDD